MILRRLTEDSYDRFVAGLTSLRCLQRTIYMNRDPKSIDFICRCERFVLNKGISNLLYTNIYAADNFEYDDGNLKTETDTEIIVRDKLGEEIIRIGDLKIIPFRVPYILTFSTKVNIAI